MDNNWMYNNTIGQGVECQVYDVGDNIVYKAYYGQIAKNLAIGEAILVEAKFAFRLQCIAYEAGIAPEPIAIAGGGYFSRMVEPLEKRMTWQRWKRFKLTEQWTKFIKTIDRIFGGAIWDLHDGNVAWDNDGNLCLIDFGYVGKENTEVGKQIALETGLFEEDWK